MTVEILKNMHSISLKSGTTLYTVCKYIKEAKTVKDINIQTKNIRSCTTVYVSYSRDLQIWKDDDVVRYYSCLILK